MVKNCPALVLDEIYTCDWRELPFPPLGDLTLISVSPALLGGFLTTSTTWEAQTFTYLCSKLGFPGGLVVKNLPTIQEMWVRSLGQEDPLEKAMATYSSILDWEIPGTEEPGRLQTMGSQKCWTRLSIHASMHLLNYLTSLLPHLIVKLMLQNAVPQIFCCFASSLHRIGLCRFQFEKCVV